MRFSQFIGQDDAKLGLILNAIDPRCGGLLLVGGKGSGKSILARLARGILPSGTPFVNLPLNVTEDSLLGGIDLEQTLRNGQRTLQPGIISRANGGVVFVDDINLLSPELLALVMEPQGRGVEIIEREGLTERRESIFSVLATINPEEGDLSPHLMDRIGLCAVMEEQNNRDRRLAIMRLANSCPVFTVEPDQEIIADISAARMLLPNVQLSPEALEYLHQVVQQNISPGHRGDLFLYAAARAYAALQGTSEVEEAHIDRVANLVFSHRRLQIREEEQATTESEQNDHNQDQQNQEQQDDQGQLPPPPENGENETENQPTGEGEQESNASSRESADREEIMQVGTPFKVRRLSFRTDRRERQASGRRTKTRVKGRGGRYVKSLLTSPDRDIAIDATLRACAPFQKARGRDRCLIIEQDDLRFRQRERRMGHLVLFVVDGSGSMGAQKRMVETKGAIQALLLDCYQKRDKVAMVVFRKDRAELVLPPTASVDLAAKRLAVLPVGGKTPLAAGLLETHNLIKRIGMRHPETRFLVVLITDGRGNQPLVDKSSMKQEVAGLTRLLAEQNQCDFIVIDTENKGNLLRADQAIELARQLEADYYTVEALQAEYLSELVQSRTVS
ncbi:MAG: VWA domain-containing protein [Desulfuromonadales bacterium]|nr:VWA domain-containing protein [Desulfuromonadales bacterium]